MRKKHWKELVNMKINDTSFLKQPSYFTKPSLFMGKIITFSFLSKFWKITHCSLCRGGGPAMTTQCLLFIAIHIWLTTALKPIALRYYIKNQKVPSSNPNRCLAWPWDPTSRLLETFRSGKNKMQSLTSGYWGCPLDNSPKLAEGQPNSS